MNATQNLALKRRLFYVPFSLSKLHSGIANKSHSPRNQGSLDLIVSSSSCICKIHHACHFLSSAADFSYFASHSMNAIPFDYFLWVCIFFGWQRRMGRLSFSTTVDCVLKFSVPLLSWWCHIIIITNSVVAKDLLRALSSNHGDKDNNNCGGV